MRSTTGLNAWRMRILVGVVLASATAGASAATLGSDSSSNSPYNGSAWNNGDNGGTGFGAWSLSTYNTDANTGSYAGFYAGDNSSNTGNVTSNGSEFGMYGENAAGGDAYRSFDTPLAVGQTFSFDLGVNYRNGYKGVDVIRTDNSQALNFNIGNDDYVVNNADSGNGSLGEAYSSNAAFHLVFHQTSAAGGTWEIDRTDAVGGVTTGTYTGVLGQFHLYIGTTGGGGQNNLNANNFAITPEPSSVQLILGGGMFGLVRRRRKAQ